jgi:hypothetical protein
MARSRAAACLAGLAYAVTTLWSPAAAAPAARASAPWVEHQERSIQLWVPGVSPSTPCVAIPIGKTTLCVPDPSQPLCDFTMAGDLHFDGLDAGGGVIAHGENFHVRAVCQEESDQIAGGGWVVDPRGRTVAGQQPQGWPASAEDGTWGSYCEVCFGPVVAAVSGFHCDPCDAGTGTVGGVWDFWSKFLVEPEEIGLAYVLAYTPQFKDACGGQPMSLSQYECGAAIEWRVGHVTGPPASVPEAPLGALLPLSALAVAGAWLRRNLRRGDGRRRDRVRG